MFYTFQNAEQLIPSGLTTQGEREWKWIELALEIPYFLVSICANSEDGPYLHRYLFGQLNDVQECLASVSESATDITIGLLSPGYVNGGNGYQLGLIKEIWINKIDDGQLFVMQDESRLNFSLSADSNQTPEWELILKL